MGGGGGGGGGGHSLVPWPPSFFHWQATRFMSLKRKYGEGGGGGDIASFPGFFYCMSGNK